MGEIWKLIHTSNGPAGSSKIYQDSEGNVRIDSFNGDVRNPEKHDRVTLNTKDGGSLSGHGYNHQDSFDTRKDSPKKQKKFKH